MRDVALFIISHEQAQFSFLYFGLVTLEGWTFPTFFVIDIKDSPPPQKKKKHTQI